MPIYRIESYEDFEDNGKMYYHMGSRNGQEAEEIEAENECEALKKYYEKIKELYKGKNIKFALSGSCGFMYQVLDEDKYTEYDIRAVLKD